MLELVKGLDNVDEVEFLNKDTKVRVSEITFSHNNIDGRALEIYLCRNQS